MKLIDETYLDDFETHARNAGACDFAGDIDYVRYFHRDFLAYGFVDGTRSDIINDFGATDPRGCIFGRIVWREIIDDNGNRSTPNVCVLWYGENAHMELLLNK
jgi:hypothetical protein